jgi:ribose 5-phosphate isomerase B
MKIALANDHAGLVLKEEIINLLKELGLEYRDFGTNSTESCDYPDFGAPAARAVASGECERGILICGTGAGMCYTANKVNGIRAVLCSEPYTATLARQHNNANVLCMGGRVIGPGLAEMIARAFLTTEFQGGRHQRRIDKVMALEKANA